MEDYVTLAALSAPPLVSISTLHSHSADFLLFYLSATVLLFLLHSV